MGDKENVSAGDDANWCKQNCSFIFRKYISDNKADRIDLASEILNVFKDL